MQLTVLTTTTRWTTTGQQPLRALSSTLSDTIPILSSQTDTGSGQTNGELQRRRDKEAIIRYPPTKYLEWYVNDFIDRVYFTVPQFLLLLLLLFHLSSGRPHKSNLFVGNCCSSSSCSSLITTIHFSIRGCVDANDKELVCRSREEEEAAKEKD